MSQSKPGHLGHKVDSSISNVCSFNPPRWLILVLQMAKVAIFNLFQLAML